MTIQPAGLYMLGTTIHGKKFRPSDWIERIASMFASFDGQRLRYNADIRPGTLNSEKCLFVGAKLANEADVTTSSSLILPAPINYRWFT